MKIVILAQVPALYETIREDDSVFPPFQMQSFWQRALSSLGHDVLAINYAQPILGSPEQIAWANLQLEATFGWAYHKARNLRARTYVYQPDNLIRSLRLSQKIESYQPDLIIVSGGVAHFGTSVLAVAKNQGAKIIVLDGEDPRISATQFTRDSVGMYDHVFVNDPAHEEAWLELGARAATAIPYAGIDPEYHQRTILEDPQSAEISSDVLFIGGLLPERQQALATLTRAGANVKIYGPPAKLLPELTAFYHGQAWGQKMIQLTSAAKIALNFVPSHMPTGGNLRTFEIPATKTLQLANRCLQAWFEPDREIVIFGDNQDLQTKVNYYLSHEAERAAIAQAGYNRVHAEHTYHQRFEKMLAILEE